MTKDPEALSEGRHMLFLQRDGWEYVEHRTAKEAAMIVALTARGEIVLAEEFRPPMNAPVVSRRNRAMRRSAWSVSRADRAPPGRARR